MSTEEKTPAKAPRPQRRRGKIMDWVFSVIPDISLETANKFYTWGWVASFSGAAITLIGVVFLMWGTRVRDHDFEKEMTNLNSEAGNARERAAKLEKRAGELEKEAGQLRLDLERERAARLPRTISDDQGQAIAHNLRVLMPHPGGKLYVVPHRFDTEAVQFADRISAVLRDGGFTVMVDGGVASRILAFNAPGVSIQMRDTKSPPPHAEPIQKAFWMTGMYFDGQSNSELFSGDDKDSVLIAVSSKPAVPLSPPFPIQPK